MLNYINNDIDENELSKEVYAHFGLTIYHIQVLEHQLINMIVVMDLIKKGNKNEDIIDFLFEKGLSKTLGQLIKQLNQFFKLKESYRLELIEILKKRNYLIHYYFKNNINLFFSTKGKKEAISYFKNFTKRVIKMDEYLTSISFDYYQKFNINEELINSEFKKMRKKWRNY